MGQQLAVDGGKPVRTAAWPSWPVWGDRERELLLDVLESGHWGELNGDKVQTFEDRFGAFQDARFALAVPNGTQALEVALQALGVGHGDEVITTSYTFIATISAILSVGAKPVMVDIDPGTNLIDPVRIEEAINSRTRAIVPVHIGGQPCDLDAVRDIARRHGLPVLEDAAQAVGAAWQGTNVGAIGDLGTFSFQASKNLNGGEGGAIVTNDAALHARCWSIHNCGRGPESGTYDFETMGGNYRMTEMAGALLLGQMDRLSDQMATRDHNAARLTAGLTAIPGLQPTAVDARVTHHAWHLYQIRYDALAFSGRSRGDFIAALNAEGIPASAGYLPLISIASVQTALRDRFGVSAVQDNPAVPVAEQAGENTIWLSQQVLLGTEQDMDDIVAACRKIVGAWSS